MKKKYAVFAGLIAAIAALAGYAVWQNNTITVTEYVFKTEKAGEFAGTRIVHVSDLHNKRFGKANIRSVSKIKSLNPNIIVISGDLVDSRHTDIPAALEFIRLISEIAPVYYTAGNHEHRFNDEQFKSLMEQIEEAGAIVLENETTLIVKNGEKLYISGLADGKNIPERATFLLSGTEDGLSILISHRPQFVSEYAEAGADLTFSGHAHGGQVHLPFIGGLIAPDQGLFPKYTEGMHYFGDSATVISRGMGNSLLPMRINNPPEIVVVDIEGK